MTKGAIVLGDGDEDNASGVFCVGAAGDCFPSVFGSVLVLLFQKIEPTLKKKAIKTLKLLSWVNYFCPLGCFSISVSSSLNNI